MRAVASAAARRADLLDQVFKRVAVELELTLLGAEGDAPVALQEGPRNLYGLDEAHGGPFPQRCSRATACHGLWGLCGGFARTSPIGTHLKIA